MAKRRSARPLTQEDREMWRRVTQSVRPVNLPSRLVSAEPPNTAAPPAKKPKQAKPPAPPKSSAKGPNPASAVQLDGKLDSRLRRGRLEPERTLDLHGLTAARAEGILRVFVEQSRAEGIRLVLVITGKGRLRDDHTHAMPQRKGVLRDHLPVWVASMGTAVVKSQPAHPRHGGAGAFYLYLRRKRGAP